MTTHEHGEVEQPPHLPGPWLHVVVDMQRLFAEDTVWHTEAMGGLVEPIQRLLRHAPNDAIFTRFVTPQRAGAAVGQWQRYYERWSMLTLDEMDPSLLDVMPEFEPWATDERCVDKTTHSLFNSGAGASHVEQRGAQTLVVSGVETDVCVLATVMDAVDRGHGVVVATDAVASSDPASHRACLDLVYPRFDQQIRCLTVDEIIGEWPAP